MTELQRILAEVTIINNLAASRHKNKISTI